MRSRLGCGMAAGLVIALLACNVLLSRRQTPKSGEPATGASVEDGHIDGTSPRSRLASTNLNRKSPPSTSPPWSTVLMRSKIKLKGVTTIEPDADLWALSSIENTPELRSLNQLLHARHFQTAARVLKEWKLEDILWQIEKSGSVERPKEDYRLFLDFYAPHFNCPTIERVGGLGDGGKWVCGVSTYLNGSKCLAYSFGDNDNTSFEQDLGTRTSCDVQVFNPVLVTEAKDKLNINNVWVWDDVMLGKENGALSKDGRDVKVRSLTTIMQDLGHNWLDVLKIDVHERDFGALKTFFDAVHILPIGQIQIRLHFHNKLREVVWLMTTLMTKFHFRIFYVEPSLSSDLPWATVDFSLIQVNKVGEVGLRGITKYAS